MTIRIEQECDKCHRRRSLSVNSQIMPISGSSSIKEAKQVGGWKELSGQDVCNDCIREFLGSF